MKWLSLLVLASLALVSTSSAVVLIDETFSYPDGLLTGQSTGWITHSGVAGQVAVGGGAIALTGANSEDVSRPFPAAVSSGVLWYGFDVTYSALPSSTTYFAHFRDSESGAATDFRARLSGVASGSGIQFRISNNSSSIFVSGGPVVPVNTTARIVASYDFTTGNSQFWVNPTAITDAAAATATDAANVVPLELMAFRQASGIGDMRVDNLLVGTSFGDVISVIPEPSTYALLGVAGLGLFFWMRRRRA